MLGKNDGGADAASAAAAAPGKKFDREFSEKEFERFCDNNNIAHDESVMNAEDANGFKELKDRFVKCCMEGRVEVDGTSVKYTLSVSSPENFRGETITIKRPTGAAMIAMDSFMERESIKKVHGLLSAMTGKDVGYFSKIDVSDWRFLNTVAMLFLSI